MVGRFQVVAVLVGLDGAAAELGLPGTLLVAVFARNTVCIEQRSQFE